MIVDRSNTPEDLRSSFPYRHGLLTEAIRYVLADSTATINHGTRAYLEGVLIDVDKWQREAWDLEKERIAARKARQAAELESFNELQAQGQS